MRTPYARKRPIESQSTMPRHWAALAERSGARVSGRASSCLSAAQMLRLAADAIGGLGWLCRSIAMPSNSDGSNFEERSQAIHWLESPFPYWAHGVVVSHPLRMRKALGSNPSVSILAPWLRAMGHIICTAPIASTLSTICASALIYPAWRRMAAVV